MQQYQINASAIASEDFGDEVIIVNMAQGNYYSLRDTGAFIWQGVAANLSTTALTDRLTTHYAIGEAEAPGIIDAFLKQLATESLLLPADPPASNSTEPVPAVGEKRPFVVPLLEVFTDMQDLLLVDPIHDVNADTGWPAKK